MNRLLVLAVCTAPSDIEYSGRTMPNQFTQPAKPAREPGAVQDAVRAMRQEPASLQIEEVSPAGVPMERLFLQARQAANRADSHVANVVAANHCEYMKVKSVLRILKDDGWVIERTRGSHRQLKHPARRGTVTVSGRPGIDVPPGTLNSILKQAGLK